MNMEIKLRQLKNNLKDYKLLEKWYKEKEIYTQFEQRTLTLEEIKIKYYPRTLKQAEIPVFMIVCNNKEVGIIQYFKVNNENKKVYGLKEKDIYEIDIFIGELNYHHKGIGTKSILILIDYLIKNNQVKKIVMCPLSSNINAINCYKKCGFEIIKKLTMKDTINHKQNYILMEKKYNINNLI